MSFISNFWISFLFDHSNWLKQIFSLPQNNTFNLSTSVTLYKIEIINDMETFRARGQDKKNQVLCYNFDPPDTAKLVLDVATFPPINKNKLLGALS